MAAELEIRQDDLDGVLLELCEMIGFENALKVGLRFSGQMVYFNKKEAILRKPRDRAIIKAFNGSNYRELALRYGLSENQVREIVKREQKGINTSPVSAS